MRKIRVVQYGVGPIGINMLRFLAERPSFEIVGAIDSDPGKIGLDIGELAGLAGPLGLQITADSSGLLEKSDADAVILTTTSSLVQIEPQVMEIISHGKNIVSTCEELSYPWITHPEIAERINRAAHEHNVTVLATGVNPGFLMDLLPLVMTGICRRMDRITVERFQDARFRRIPFQVKIGAGLTIEEFGQRVREGKLRHVGLTESMHMIAAAVGWRLERTEDMVSPVVATENIPLNGITIEPGKALGVHQVGTGHMNGREVIKLIFQASVGEPRPRDRIHIEGTPEIDLEIRNGVNGDAATCAIVVNAVPAVLRAPCGLLTMKDIPPVSYCE